MIFTRESIEKIRRGEKTETRRIWKVPHVKVGGEYGTRVSRREKEAGYPRIRVTDMWVERLGEIDGDAARREGFSGVPEFVKLWVRLHPGPGGDPAQKVHVIRFERVS